MANESTFWAYLRKGMGARWKAERVENRLAAGFPDVFFTIDGVHGLVELKYLPKKKKTITISHFTDEQRAFSYRHKTPILIQIENEYLFMGSEHALLVGRGQPLSDHISWAVARWTDSVDFEGLKSALLAESNKG